MPDPKPESCQTCKFWNSHFRNWDKDLEFCQRHAPLLITVSGFDGKDEQMTMWPRTYGYQGCGDHVPVGEAGEVK